MFIDRREAGERLSVLVKDRVRPPAVVLAIPRGGILVADPVATALGWPLDLVVPKKLGAPGNPELGIGAVAPGVRVLDEDLISALRVPRSWIEAETEREQAEVERRSRAYRGEAERVEIAGTTAVIVDDGVATGVTARAAAAWARAQAAAKVVLAVPVAPPGTADRLSGDFDEVIVVETPRWFRAVGQWYEDFDQVTDEEVRAVLATRSR